MTIALQNLKSTKGTTKRKKRLGRGDSSGSGSYSGRGMKGQKSRSGGRRGLKRKGLSTFLRNVPKRGGFKSIKDKMSVVNLQDLEKHFNNGDTISYVELLKKNLINDYRLGVKVLGQGKLTKKLVITADSFSKTAKDAIIKAGGKAELKLKKSKNTKFKKKKKK